MSYPHSVFLDGAQIHHVEGFALDLNGWDVPTPEVRDATVDYARRHGAANDSAYLGPASAALRLVVWGDTAVQLQQRVDSLRSRMRPGADTVLAWRHSEGGPLWQITMRLAGPVETRRHNGLWVTVAATLKSSSSPLALSSDLHESFYDPTLSHRGIGVTYDLVYDLDFTGTPETSSLDLFNAGNMPTSPLWIITGPVDDPVIEDQASGAEISTTASLGGSDTLWVDVARRTARLNAEDGTLRLDLIDEANTTWFDLQPGPNAVRLTGSGMTTGETLLTARWRDARLPD